MKKLTKFIIGFLIFILSPAFCLSGQTGSIEGTVTDKTNSETLIGTTISIDGTTIGTTSDIEGHFVFQNLKAGVYNLKISYISYATKLIENVKVEAGKTVFVNVLLEGNMVSLGDITVTAIRKTNTEISMITDIRATSFVSTGISGQQISRTLDKDASEVVKRVPGITIIDNRFLVVRGLSQRYNNVWLNNAATPSSEADVKAFSFDIIPSSMIENIMIFKSAAAELPADFSGGFVKITTKNMPEKNSLSFSYGTGYNGSSTFKQFYAEDKGKTDFLGFDNGSRALPKDMPSHLNVYDEATNPAVLDKITQLGRALSKNWVPVPTTAIPDQKLFVGLNRKWEVGKLSLGNVTALTYSLSNSSDNIIKTDYSIYNFLGDRPSFVNEFNDNQYSSSARVALMNNTSLYLKNGTKIEIRNLLNQSGVSRITTRTGRDWYNDGKHIRSDEIRYVSRLVYTGQLAGEHKIKNDGSKLEWVLGYATSNKKEPDTRRYRYIRSEEDTTIYLICFIDEPDLSSLSRMWIDLKENTVSASLIYTTKFKNDKYTPELKTGLYFENKDRKFLARNFGYARASFESVLVQTSLPINEIFTDDNINLTNGIKLVEITGKSDSYTASNTQMAAFISGRIPIGQKITVYSGIRIERNRQTLESYKQSSNTRVSVDRDTINLFPSANITYDFNPKSLLRLAYGMTVNRPEFREIAPFYYVDFELNAGIYGAPHIVQAYIHSFDIRYEFYPGSGETFNIGAFYKKFINPIEQVVLGNSPTQYSFENVDGAYSIGLEAEVRKSLGFIDGLDNFSIVMNSSLISSRVQFNKNTLRRNRPLEGQSPYIVNAGLFYQNKANDMMVSLMYNVIGKRIVAVGRTFENQWEDIPDIYEMPRNIIDLTVSKMLGKKIEIKAGIKDLLNENIRYVQTINTMVDMEIYSEGTISGMKYFNRDQVTKSYSPGRYFSLEISLKL